MSLINPVRTLFGLLDTPPGGGGGGGGASADWRTSLPEDIRADPSLADFKDVGSMAKSFISAQRMIGTDKIAKPTDKWTDKEWGEFNKQLGVPDTFDKYPDADAKLPDGVTMNPEKLTEWKKIFQTAGIRPDQAKKLLNKFYEESGGEFTAAQQRRMQDEQNAVNVLKQEFGDKYDSQVDIARSVIKKFGNDEFAVKLASSGLGSDPTFVKMLAKIGSAILDDRAAGSGDGLTIKSATAAQGEIEKLKGDSDFQKALMTREHPGHKDALARWTNLFRVAANEG